MAGRTKSEAFENFRGMVQEAVSCFTDARVAGNIRGQDGRGVLTANGGNPFPLKSTERRVSVSIAISYALNRVDGEWRVSTEQYIHRVLVDGEPDVDFHWHPDEQTRLWYPHIHPRFAGAGREKGKTHIPSGRVFIEDVLVFAYERGAQPRKADWESILIRNKERLSSELTWGTPFPLIYRPQPKDLN